MSTKVRLPAHRQGSGGRSQYDHEVYVIDSAEKEEVFGPEGQDEEATDADDTNPSDRTEEPSSPSGAEEEEKRTAGGGQQNGDVEQQSGQPTPYAHCIK